MHQPLFVGQRTIVEFPGQSVSNLAFFDRYTFHMYISVISLYLYRLVLIAIQPRPSVTKPGLLVHVLVLYGEEDQFDKIEILTVTP